MTGEYLVFKKKDAAMRYIEANPGCGLRLFNEDYDETAGAKRQILSTADVIYSKIFTKAGSLRKGDHNRYEYLDEKCKFGIDADLMTQGSLYTPDFDCRPKLREFMQKVNNQMDEVFSIKLTSRDWIILRSDYKHPTPKLDGLGSHTVVFDLPYEGNYVIHGQHVTMTDQVPEAARNDESIEVADFHVPPEWIGGSRPVVDMLLGGYFYHTADGIQLWED